MDNTYTELNYLGIGRYGSFDNILVHVPESGHYIVNLHTKELGLTVGNYEITVWLQAGTLQIEDTYLFELTDNIQGKGRGKGRSN